MTGGLFGRVGESSRAKEIDNNRHDDHSERPNSRFYDVRLVLEKALERFPDHYSRKQEQQGRFGQCRDSLHLAVAIVMLFIGRLARNTYRDIGYHCGAEID